MFWFLATGQTFFDSDLMGLMTTYLQRRSIITIIKLRWNVAVCGCTIIIVFNRGLDLKKWIVSEEDLSELLSPLHLFRFQLKSSPHGPLIQTYTLTNSTQVDHSTRVNSNISNLNLLSRYNTNKRGHRKLQAQLWKPSIKPILNADRHYCTKPKKRPHKRRSSSISIHPRIFLSISLSFRRRK